MKANPLVVLSLCLSGSVVAVPAAAQIPLSQMNNYIQRQLNDSARRPERPARQTVYAELAKPLLAAPGTVARSLTDEQRQFLSECRTTTQRLIPLADRAVRQQSQLIARLRVVSAKQDRLVSESDDANTLEHEIERLEMMKERLYAMRTGELIVPPLFARQPAIGDIGRLPAKSNPVRVRRILDATGCLATIQWPDRRADIIITGINTAGMRPNDDLVVEMPLRVQKLEHRPQLIFEAFDARELTPLWNRYKLERGLD